MSIFCTLDLVPLSHSTVNKSSLSCKTKKKQNYEQTTYKFITNNNKCDKNDVCK